MLADIFFEFLSFLERLMDYLAYLVALRMIVLLGPLLLPFESINSDLSLVELPLLHLYTRIDIRQIHSHHIERRPIPLIVSLNLCELWIIR